MPHQTDQLALLADWLAVDEDLRFALAGFGQEYPWTAVASAESVPSKERVGV